MESFKSKTTLDNLQTLRWQSVFNFNKKFRISKVQIKRYNLWNYLVIRTTWEFLELTQQEPQLDWSLILSIGQPYVLLLVTLYCWRLPGTQENVSGRVLACWVFSSVFGLVMANLCCGFPIFKPSLCLLNSCTFIFLKLYVSAFNDITSTF